MTATPSTAQPTTCPRCPAPMTPGELMCDRCYRAEPWSCRRCGEVDYLLGGLCPDCTMDDAAADLVDPDAPVPFELTAQGLAALRAVEVA